MTVIEPITVFSRAGLRERTYNPQMYELREIIDRLRQPWQQRLFSPFLSGLQVNPHRMSYRTLNPIDLVSVERCEFDKPRIQHGQKPIELMRYLIRTLTNQGDLILDITAGSMTTAVAAALERRRFIVFEQERNHFVLGVERLRRLYAAKKLPEL